MDLPTILRAFGVPLAGGAAPPAAAVRKAYRDALLRFHPDRQREKSPAVRAVPSCCPSTRPSVWTQPPAPQSSTERNAAPLPILRRCVLVSGLMRGTLQDRVRAEEMFKLITSKMEAYHGR